MSALCPSPSAFNPSFHSGAAITCMCSLSALHFDETHGTRCLVSLKEHFRAEQHLTRAICLCSWILWCPAARLFVPGCFVNHAVLKCLSLSSAFHCSHWTHKHSLKSADTSVFTLYLLCFVFNSQLILLHHFHQFDLSYL